MRFTLLTLKNWRSYKSLVVELSPGVNIVVGPNASGKTNLLEALLVVCRGSSYRAGDAELIREGAEWARVDVEGDERRTLKISKVPHGARKELVIEEAPIKRLTANRIAPVTLFEPEHLRMVQGPPELRRDYLDNLLEQLEPGYGEHLRRYRRALSQRNRLLKSRPPRVADQIFVWDLKMSEHGAVVVAKRRELVARINRDAAKLYSRLSGHRSKLELEYHAHPDSEEYGSALLKALQGRLETDLERGFTTVGPHRDDFSFILNKHDAANTASRGESRTLVLMLNLVELQLLEEQRGQPPILLLDDVFSELDGARRRALTEYLQPYQTIITTTDADSVIEHFAGDYNVIPTSTN